MSVIDLSLQCRAIRDTLDVPGTSHLHLEWFEMESLLLVYPIVCGGSVFREGWEVGARARWDPIWTDPASCQLSPQWLRTLPTHQQPSKGACPPAHPECSASSISPLPHYWQKGGESRKLLNHSTSCWSLGSHLSYRMHCNAQLVYLMFFYRFNLSSRLNKQINIKL